MFKKTSYIAFDGVEFGSESECRKYEKSKIVNITQEMTDELNQLLAEQGCIFKFRFKTYLTDSSIGVIYPEFINRTFILNSRCEIDGDGEAFIKKFLSSKGIDWISHTAGGGIIAYQHDNQRY